MHLLDDLNSSLQFLFNHICENCTKAFLKLEKKYNNQIIRIHKEESKFLKAYFAI